MIVRVGYLAVRKQNIHILMPLMVVQAGYVLVQLKNISTIMKINAMNLLVASTNIHIIFHVANGSLDIVRNMNTLMIPTATL